MSKKYILVKDLPTFKAGEKFCLSLRGNLVKDDGNNGIVAYAKQTLEKFPNILKDWFKEVEDCWKPKGGEKYYFLSSYGEVRSVGLFAVECC